jgi:ParB family chromosome partitioning protein
MDKINNLLQEMVPIEKLNKSPYNPRFINTVEFKALQDSLKEFGFVEPLVVNLREDSSFTLEEKVWTIVGGHQRFEAAKSLGYKEVPVVFVNVTKEKEKILNLALNKISGEWDTDQLAEILYELTQEDQIPESEILGFSHEEINAILNTIMDIGEEEKEKLENGNPNPINKCPKCGYEW